MRLSRSILPLLCLATLPTTAWAWYYRLEFVGVSSSTYSSTLAALVPPAVSTSLGIQSSYVGSTEVTDRAPNCDVTLTIATEAAVSSEALQQMITQGTLEANIYHTANAQGVDVPVLFSGIKQISPPSTVKSPTASSGQSDVEAADEDHGISMGAVIAVSAITGVLVIGGLVGAKMARSKAKEDAEAEAALFEYAAEREQQVMESKERLLDKEHEAERRALVLEKRSGMKQPELSAVETNVTEATSVSMEFRQMALYERFQEVYTIILPKLKETAELMRHYTALESVDVNDPESADILASLKEGVSMAFAGKLGGANLAQSCKDAENLRDRLMNSKASFKSYNALTWSVNFLRERRNAEESIDEPRGQGLVRKRVYDEHDEQRSGRITSYSEDDGLYSIKWNDGDEVRVSFAVVERLLEDWEEEETDIDLLFAEESDEVQTFLVDSFEKFKADHGGTTAADDDENEDEVTQLIDTEACTQLCVFCCSTLDITLRTAKIKAAMKGQLHIPREVDQDFWTSDQFYNWFFYNIIFDHRLQTLEQKLNKRRRKEEAKLAEAEAAYQAEQKQMRKSKSRMQQLEVEM